MTASDTKNQPARAIARPNIALIKYWGKADARRNIPAVGSLSITLDELATTTTVAESGQDVFLLNGEAETAMATRCFAFIDRFWSGDRPRLSVSSDNNFPTAAGLASSASGFAALTVALDAFFASGLPTERLAQIAGAGSGSAARSLYGGFVRLDAPTQADDDISLRPVAVPADFPLAVVIAITSEQRKKVGSTEAMQRTAQTSPYYSQWVAGQDADLDAAEAAVVARDFERLAELSEWSCLKMHAVMQAARPGLIYWNAATMACMQRIRELRDEGCRVFFTIDAGPQVKAVCSPGDAERVSHELAALEGVRRVLRTGLGAGASRVAIER